jgi:hypothetical protein
VTINETHLDVLPETIKPLLSTQNKTAQFQKENTQKSTD